MEKDLELIDKGNLRLKKLYKQGRYLLGILIWRSKYPDHNYGFLMTNYGCSWIIRQCDIPKIDLSPGQSIFVKFNLQKSSNPIGYKPIKVKQAEFGQKLEILFYSSSPKQWKPIAATYLNLLNENEIIQAIGRKAKTIRPESPDAIFLFRNIPEKAMLLPSALSLREVNAYHQHLQLLLQMIEAEPNNDTLLDELINRIRKEKKIYKKNVSVLQKILDLLTNDFKARLLSEIRTHDSDVSFSIPFALRKYASFQNYLEHIVSAISESSNDDGLFRELVDRMKQEKRHPPINFANVGKFLNYFSEDQQVELACQLCKLNGSIKLDLPKSLYFHDKAQPLRDRLSNKKRWEYYDWGVAIGIPDEKVQCILVEKDDRRAVQFWNARAKYIKYDSQLFELAPRTVQDKVLRKHYDFVLKVWSPNFDSAQFDPNGLRRLLGPRDWRLAKIWTGHQSESGKIYESTLALMLSARIAEKATKIFYERLGYKVADISIQQLDAEDYDWVTHDLELGNGLQLDVKNARFPRNGKANYVEHMIPRFKHTRESLPVQIVGVVSPHMNLKKYKGEQYLGEFDTFILGETSESRIKELIEYGNRVSILDTSALVSIRRPIQNSTRYHLVYPPWIFDYPESFYRKTRRDLEELKKISDEAFPPLAVFHRLGENIPFRLLLAAGRELPKQWRESIATWQSRLYNRILLSGSYRSLPALFLSILQDFSTNVLCPPKSYSPSRYQRMIFSVQDRSLEEIDEWKYPLGLYDPLCQVWSLCINLEAVWKELGPSGLRQFESFRFQGLGILRGKERESKIWKTLIAYCGGETDNKVACGNPDLVIGKKGIKPCPECGYLVCPKCNWCKYNCSENEKRRSKTNEEMDEYPMFGSIDFSELAGEYPVFNSDVDIIADQDYPVELLFPDYDF